jgi:UDP-2,4-diacetamido-2,4,6-trideoxy-beta-L-altropyranose hydrolase
MRIALRVDASSRIGLGHLLRCLSLAQALKRCGAEPRFLLRTSDVDGDARVRAAGFTSIQLPLPAVHAIGHLADGEADAQACIAALRDAPPAWVIVDHYGLDASWHRALRDALGCRIAAIDDLADRPLDVDTLIDHNLVPAGSHPERYAAVLQRQPARWLCGPRHALLGPAYADLPTFTVQPEVRSLGIFMGGTDPLGTGATVLAACRDAGFTGPVEIVATSASPALPALQTATAADGHATLSLDLPDLAAFYARHDLQIGAGGGGAWERCAVGVPSLTLCVADNQRAVIPALVAMGATAGAEGITREAIAAALRPLLADAARRRQLSQTASTVVDGWGARRVALALCAGQRPTLRAATMADAELLWQWRNHPATRAVSRQPDEIPLASHRQWLQRLLDTGSSRLRIASLGGLDFGVIRFDPLHDDAWEVSLYLAPQLHGLGLGTALLRAGEQALRDDLGTPLHIHAEVLPGNTGSLRLFESAGYVQQPAGHWIKPLA